MAVDDEKCTLCDKCRRDCPVDIGIYDSANSPSCIRCLKCVDSCKYGAVSYDFLGRHEVAEDAQARQEAA
jgi:uncharacterized Fe-S center protein